MPAERGSFESGHDIQGPVPRRAGGQNRWKGSQGALGSVLWAKRRTGSGLGSPGSQSAWRQNARVTGLTLKGMGGASRCDGVTAVPSSLGDASWALTGDNGLSLLVQTSSAQELQEKSSNVMPILYTAKLRLEGAQGHSQAHVATKGQKQHLTPGGFFFLSLSLCPNSLRRQ